MRIFLFSLIFSLSFLIKANKGITFKQNKNQWPHQVLYGGELATGQVFVEKTGLTFQLWDAKDLHTAHQHNKSENIHSSDTANQLIKGHNYKVEFVNALFQTNKTGTKLPEYYNYFLGNNPKKWASNVSAFESVYFTDVYKNIDVKFYNNNGTFKYDFIVKKGANFNSILLDYKFVERLYLNDKKLIIQTSIGNCIESIPEAYQLINGKKIIINCEYQINKNKVSFVVGQNYNANYDLIIDPSVVVASYTGTESLSYGLGTTFDKDGSIFLYSLNLTKNYPTTFGAIQTTYNGGARDCTLSKFNPTGSAKFFSTYIGGNKNESILNCVVQNEEIVLFGYTNSDTMPIIKNGFQPVYAGGPNDYFIIKLDTTGKTLLASTFIGGKRSEAFISIGSNTRYYGVSDGEMVLDKQNNCYFIGNTSSLDFPTTPGCINPFSDSTNYGNLCICKLNKNLTQLVWGTQYGGSFNEEATGLRLGASGNLYCLGTTNSNNFPTSAGVVYPSKLVTSDMVLVVVNANTGSLVAASYMGSKGLDISCGIDLDLNENVYVYGTTSSPQTVTCTPGVYCNSIGNVVFYKVKNDLSQVLLTSKFGYSTTNQLQTEIDAFNIDSCGYIYFGGFGYDGLPTTSNAFKNNTNNGSLYFGIFNPNFSSLKFASYYGGDPQMNGAFIGYDHDDGGKNYFDDKGYFYHGLCLDNTFPITTNAYASFNTKDSILYFGNSYYHRSDAFIKIDMQTFVNASSTLGGELKSCSPITTTFIASTNLGTVSIIPGDGSPAVASNSLIHTYSTYGIYNAYVIAGTDTSTCNQTDSIKILIKYGAAPTDALNDTTVNCLGLVPGLDAKNSGSTYLWNSGETSQVIVPEQNAMYYVNIDNGFCNKLDSSYLKILPVLYPMILPNIITPNNDNVNDYWDFGKYGLQDLEFIVFNRWGGQVYKTSTITDKWNGTNQQGQALSDGTYFWVINYKSNCNVNERIQQKGYIQVVR